MLYDIRLRIAYDYDTPSDAGRMILRMLPRGLGHQNLISGLIETDPRADHRTDGTDFFGNPVTHVAFDQRFSTIDFTFNGRVRRLAPASRLDLSAPLDQMPRELAKVAGLEPDAPQHFVGPSPRIPYSSEIADFATQQTAQGQSTLDAVRAVSGAVHRHFTFDPEATEVTTTPVDAFASGRGVCQDISHVTICALRAIGVPAGYVSGFLRTVPPPGKPRLEGADAMHAWVRAWCGAEAGWVEIDPTNDMDAGTDHIVVAYGRDYSDVAPVKGQARSAGAHSTTHSVDVIPVDD